MTLYGSSGKPGPLSYTLALPLQDALQQRLGRILQDPERKELPDILIVDFKPCRLSPDGLQAVMLNPNSSGYHVFAITKDHRLFNGRLSPEGMLQLEDGDSNQRGYVNCAFLFEYGNLLLPNHRNNNGSSPMATYESVTPFPLPDIRKVKAGLYSRRMNGNANGDNHNGHGQLDRSRLYAVIEGAAGHMRHDCRIKNGHGRNGEHLAGQTFIPSYRQRKWLTMECLADKMQVSVDALSLLLN